MPLPRIFIAAGTRRGLLILAASAALFGAAMLPAIATMADHGASVIDFESAGSVARSQQILVEWGEGGKRAMWWQLALDTPFALSYGLLLAGCCAAVARRARVSGKTRLGQVAQAFAWLGPVGAAADLLQNFSLAIVLAGSTSQPWPRIAALSVPTTLILAAAAAVFAAVGALATRRPAGRDPLTAPSPTLLELVEAVRALDYGRPSERSVEAMVRERRGTCSAKHLFLAARLRELFPECDPQIVHRVYRVDRAQARERLGEQASALIPAEGLVDVHRYLTIDLNGRRTTIDATFPGPAWDGSSDLPLACGPGDDYPSAGDPNAEKRRLEAEFCDPELREPFIAALSA
jgi:hypothetical protein